MEDNRTERERVVDKLLLLNLMSKGTIGKVKLQKTVFFSEDHMNNDQIKSFSYSFKRWHHGQYSEQLESDLGELVKENMLNESHIPNDETKFTVTESGRHILENAKCILGRNKKIIERVEMFADYTRKNKLKDVLDSAYNKSPIKGELVRDIPEGEHLLSKLQDSETKCSFDIEDGWVETFDIMFDKKASDALDEAMNERTIKDFEL